MTFPKIMPSVIVGVLNGDRLLLIRYNRPNSRMTAMVAGFTEIGESAEQTVQREVMEEVGLKVKDITFYKTEPFGISAGGLLMGFWCRVDGSYEIRPDGEEIAEGKWYTREELASFYTDPGYSLTGEMTMQFILGNYPKE